MTDTPPWLRPAIEAAVVALEKRYLQYDFISEQDAIFVLAAFLRALPDGVAIMGGTLTDSTNIDLFSGNALAAEIENDKT